MSEPKFICTVREYKALQSRILELEERWNTLPPSSSCCECERLKARIRELEEKLLDKERDIEEANYGEDL